MNIKLLILLLFFPLCVNAKNDDAEKSMVLKDSLVLVLEGGESNIPMAFYCDSVANLIYFAEQDAICVYSLKTKALVHKTPIFPYNLFSATCIYAPSEDFMILGDFNSSSLVVIEKGKPYSKYRIEKDLMLPVSNAFLLNERERKIVFTTWGDNNSLFFLDRDTREFTKCVPRPKIYKYNWGGLLMLIPYAVYNTKTDVISISFPASEKLYHYNCHSGRITTTSAPSEHITSITPLSTNSSMEVDIQAEMHHFFITDNYSNILYDSYRDIYYRIAEIHTPEMGKNKSKRLSVVILDSSFNKIGETDLGRTFSNTYRYRIFVTKAGLHIQTDSDSGKMVFYIYQQADSQ